MAKDDPNKKTAGTQSYAETGVDIHAADDWVERLQKMTSGKVGAGPFRAPQEQIVSGIGDYASVFALSPDQYVATSCDGVGTKLLWTLAGLGSAENLAVDLLAMNSNDLLCVGARPTLFLDYLAVGSKNLLKPGGVLEKFMTGLNAACLGSGQLLVGGETAQMPDLYEADGFDLAGFNVGFLKPTELLGVENITPGSSLWAWPSSGPHSNGFTLLRSLFDTQADAEFISKALMPPTKLYVNEFLDLRQSLEQKSLSKSLQAAFHLTGSGLWNLLRAQPKTRKIGFELNLKESQLPQWLREIQKRSTLGLRELGETFNMGWGMAIVLGPELGESNKDLLHSKGLTHIGSVVDQPHVKFLGQTLET